MRIEILILGFKGLMRQHSTLIITLRYFPFSPQISGKYGPFCTTNEVRWLQRKRLICHLHIVVTSFLIAVENPFNKVRHGRNITLNNVQVFLRPS